MIQIPHEKWKQGEQRERVTGSQPESCQGQSGCVTVDIALELFLTQDSKALCQGASWVVHTHLSITL